MNLRTAVILLSGGLDSSVSLALALEKGWNILLALNIDYGQRAALRERTSSRDIADHYNVPFKAIALPWFESIPNTGSLINRQNPIPRVRVTDLGNPGVTIKSAKEVWVPNRNGLLIEIAACYAEALGATAVFVGFNREEAATFPDNSASYVQAINQSLSYSTSNQVFTYSPILQMDKSEIVDKAIQIGFPFEKIWSCYEGGDIPCGVCESCQRLHRALKEKNYESPFHSSLS
jgi:7-cyano-7-deazaguanine synthase